MSAEPRPGRAVPAADRASVADLPARHRAKIARLLRMMERENWDRERERRRRHAALLSKWAPHPDMPRAERRGQAPSR